MLLGDVKGKVQEGKEDEGGRGGDDGDGQTLDSCRRVDRGSLNGLIGVGPKEFNGSLGQGLIDYGAMGDG